MAIVASFPGSPPRAHKYCMTFDPHEESRGEPGEFYHVSDVKGREDLTGCEKAYGSILSCSRLQAWRSSAHTVQTVVSVSMLRDSLCVTPTITQCQWS